MSLDKKITEAIKFEPMNPGTKKLWNVEKYIKIVSLT